MSIAEGASYFKGLSRRDYIQKAHEIIMTEGISAVSIRRLAKEMGCSSTSMYRYFASREELIYHAELPILRDYIRRLNEAEKTWKTIWHVYVGVWDCYSREAFRHPEAFDLLFFKDNDLVLKHAIREYYNMFPEDIRNTNEIFQEMLQTPTFESRDMLICQKCIREGAITPEDGVKLNRMVCMLFSGNLKYILDHRSKPINIDKQVEIFIEDVDTIVRSLASDLRGYEKYS